MPAIHTISVDKLFRLVGTHGGPTIVDVRGDTAFASEGTLIPSAIKRDAMSVDTWATALTAENVIVVCETGSDSGPGAAAWLRQIGKSAETLEGGHAAWRAAKLPVVPQAVLPPRDALGRTRWVTRARPKVDRIACPWLIRRFVDPQAVFLYVAPEDVLNVAHQFDAAAFDISGDGVTWSHDGERCTFDVMVQAFGLGGIDALQRLAMIVRGADTDRLDVARESAGLLAASLGLSRMYSDDHEQLAAGLTLYDAFYRWCRDATGETHNWSSHKPKGQK
jgi:rhodanese-related sulfurtransferase